VIARAFHGWERRLASAATDRIVRPFEWGLEWIEPRAGKVADPAEWLEQWADTAVATSGSYFDLPPCDEYRWTAIA
jgi:hypothetical protein